MEKEIIKAVVIDTIYTMLYTIAELYANKKTKAAWDNLIESCSPPINRDSVLAANSLVLVDQVIKIMNTAQKKGQFTQGKRSIELVELQAKYQMIMEKLRR